MSDPNREGEDFARARRGRNIAIAVGLVIFIVLVYVVTVVRMGANVIDRPI
jgi:tetrahydromethanopterin S-methyltransferase subunit G